ncbi:MAG: efflux RND transporter permease subunit [Hyphomicrobiaceae bacterium]|nr:efflux RND transporter permease subunit [Hyphomicrobiaceae bacterium]
MWIVHYAISHRHSVGVLAALTLLFGLLSGRNMSSDILPTVDIPAINIVWTYQGLNPQEMASKITSFSELAVLNNVDNIREVRSETLNGLAIVRIDFQPGTDVTTAFAQVTSVSQTILRRMPQGTTPPLIIPFVPSSVPVLQLVIASDTLNDGALFDYARLQLRAQIQSIPGIRLTLPYGGAPRQIMIDLRPEALQANGLSPSDVARAVAAQNLTLPSGALRTDAREILITTNASPETVTAFADLPIRSVEGRTVRLADVASVRDGQAVQTNIARLNGQNAVMVSVLKLGDASTLDIVNQIKARLGEIRSAAPEGVTIEPVFDQSVFVGYAIDALAKEAVIVACLVGFVVLLFLGNWRSSFIVLTSIPLSLLASVGGLALTGNTFNLMTLGGLMLAIGILVDNALVEVENIDRNIEKGLPVDQAVLKSASEVAFPEFVSTCAICIVFSPLFLLTGIAAFVFVPLALAVIFALVASYILSRTLVPTLATMMLKPVAHGQAHDAQLGAGHGEAHAATGPVGRFLDGLASLMAGLVRLLVRFKILPFAGVVAALVCGTVASLNVGREFFPETDAGMLRIYVRAAPGQRVEETATTFAEVQRTIREVVPADELALVAESIGSPDPINQAWVASGVVGSFDGDILVQLADGHAGTAHYVSALRRALRQRHPELTFYFRPADATAQTLAGSAQTAIELRIVGRDGPGNMAMARRLIQDIGSVEGAVDLALRQVPNLPTYHLEIDRARALQIGVTPQDATNALLAALGSGGTVAPSYWSDPQVGLSYTVQIVAPPANLMSVEQVLNTPVRAGASGELVPLRTFATLQLRQSAALVERATLQPMLTILMNVEGRDLGGVYGDVARIVSAAAKDLKPGNRIEIAGQAREMDRAYAEMAGGLGLAAVLVYLVMVVNFQSWLLPLIAMGSAPIAVMGALVGLYALATPLSVPALTGLIMVIGVSTANSVLVISFARDELAKGATPLDAALDAVRIRLRPVLMTATAMIIGMIPMALGVGEGGEQNAPLGRAVVAGLVFGTVATLTFVPFLFAVLARGRRMPAGAAADASETEIAHKLPAPVPGE